MAKTTEYTYEGDGIINSWAVPFAYLKKSHVKVYIDDVEDTTFTWLTDSSVAATSTPADGAIVRVKRVTPRDALDTVLGNSGTFRGNDINNQSRQALYVAEEGYDALVGVLQLDATVNEWDFGSYQSKNIPTPTSDDSAANKAYVDAVAGSATAAAASATAAAASASTASTAATNASNSASAAASSASSASTSASTATTKAAEAAASAASVAGEADAAAASAVTAASEASDAADSATAAASSQSAAAGSATAAAGSASAASTSATNAASSASSASTSASTATTQAGIATTKATEASNSATAAAGSATTASGHATTATTQAGIATTQATAAAASATAAGDSETAAAASATAAGNAQTAAETAQTAAETALDTFDDIWLGSKTSAPTLDNDGNALQQGALYWNSTTDDLWVYNAGAWEVAALPASGAYVPPSDDGAALGSASLKWSDLFLASGAVINFNASDVTLTHALNSLAVGGGDLSLADASFGLNFGSKATTGNDVSKHIDLYGGTYGINITSSTLGLVTGGSYISAYFTGPSGAFHPTSNDSGALGISTHAWSDLFLASGSVINFNAGDVTLTHSANTLTHAGGIFTATWDGAAGTHPVIVKNTTDSSSVGALRIEGDRATPANNDQVYASFYQSNAVGTQKEAVRLTAQLLDVTNTAEYGQFTVSLVEAGSLTTHLALNYLTMKPGVNDQISLGQSGTAWSDLFLASGATIDFNAGDVTLTHVANTLRMNGGNFNIVGGNNVIGWENGVEGGLWLTKTSQYGTAAVQGIDSSFSAAAIALNPAGGDVLFGTTSAVLNDTIINTQKALAVREQNLIVNSTMHFSQENGDTASSATAGPIAYYGADQWWSGWDVSTSTITGGGLYSAGNGPNRELDRWIYLKSTAAVTYGADEYALFSTKVEGLRWRKLGWGASGAKGAKIGFWVYSSNTTGTMCVAFRETGGNYYYVVDVTVNSAATWEWKEVTIPGPTVGTWSAVNTAAVEISFVFGCGSTFGGATTDAWTAGNKVASSNITNFMAGANHEVRATGVFIVPEDVEFPASVSTYGYLMARLKELEIVECRRYFRQSYSDGTQAGTTTATGQIAFNGGGTQSYHNVHIPFDTKMRTGPTVNVISPITGASAKLYNATGAADVNANTATTTINGFILRVNNVSLTDVSLQAHYTANARM